MKTAEKKWIVKKERKRTESLLDALLEAREISDPFEFFSDADPAKLHNPFLFPQMQKAVDRIFAAIDSGERIVIYGDYDVDGNSGAALLVHTLKDLGAEVSYRIPHRTKDGYGLHEKYVRELAGKNVKILISVDCGISCAPETELAENLGMNVIITDHHTIPETLPNAFAILHPRLTNDNYPFDALSGSGVAFKLASALLIHAGKEDSILNITDLASLGTVADMVPLIGENRTIVKLGLKQMEQTDWDGLKAILVSSGAWGGKEFNAETIGFQVGPRINAAGRMDDPMWSIQTLLATGDEALQKSKILEEFNDKRKHRTIEIMAEAEQHFDPSQPVIIAESKNWSSGLVGLIAGKLQDKYMKPAFILEDKGETLVGSARSFKGFHCVDALKHASDLLVHFGGHEQAAGFLIQKTNYPAFKSRLLEYATEHFLRTPPAHTLEIDTRLFPGEITLANFDTIEKFAPFGIGNQKPVFLIENIKIISTKLLGKEGEHLKFQFSFGEEVFDGIGFNMGDKETQLLSANSIVCQLEKNEWNDRVSLQLRLVDIEH